MNLVFNKDLKMNYSWLPKGFASSIINDVYIGSKSLITAFWSDGEYICATLNQTVDSEWFQGFIWIVKFLLNFRKKEINNGIVLMLDNASYHSSKNTKERLVNLEFNTKFLPPYSPNLAPVEQFFKLLKSKIRSYDFDNTIKLSTHKGTELIQKASSDIKALTLKRIWSDFVKTAHELIAKIS